MEDLKPGIYHYSVQDHSLELIKEGDARPEFTKAAFGQGMIQEAPITFVWTSVWERIKVKYGERAERYVYMEAGHISENVYLQATSMDLGTVAIGAFDDHECNKILGVDGVTESVVYMQPVGKL